METMAEIGERIAIEKIKDILNSQDLSVDIGDDCGAFPIDNETSIIVSTDMITEQTHIPSAMKPWDIGWFIVAINLSDIAAKGGKPIGIVLSCGLPISYTVSDFIEIMQGAKACAKEYGTLILGGDTKENQHLTLSGTAFGNIISDLFMHRKGAQENDIVAVTGTLGKAAAGYYNLKTEKKQNEMIKGLIHPLPQIEAGNMLALTKKIHCCMDISDGLSSSLHQLSTINNLGFEIDPNEIPVSPMLSKMLKKKPVQIGDDAVLHWGGDYELLCTLSEKDFPTVQHKLTTRQINLTPIGLVTKQKQVMISSKTGKKILPNKGYEHFKSII